jgi:hypothetical protein
MPLHRARLPALLLLGPLAGLGGCGRLADETYQGPPISTLSGYVGGTQAPPGAQVLLSLRWLEPTDTATFFRERPSLPPLEGGGTSSCIADDAATGGCGGAPWSGGQRWETAAPAAAGLEQPLRYESAWGGLLSLQLHHPPPAAALYDLTRQGGQGQLALAVVVATVDEDGDGRVRQGTPLSPPEPALAGSLPQRTPGVLGSLAPRRSVFLAFLDGVVAPAGVAIGAAPDRPFAPSPGFGLWVKEEVLDPKGRPASVALRAAAGGGLDETITLYPYQGAEQWTVWCTGWSTEVAFLPSLPAGAGFDACYQIGPGTWERTTPVAPCRFRTDRFWVDFSCATAPGWFQEACP